MDPAKQNGRAPERLSRTESNRVAWSPHGSVSMTPDESCCVPPARLPSATPPEHLDPEKTLFFAFSIFLPVFTCRGRKKEPASQCVAYILGVTPTHRSTSLVVPPSSKRRAHLGGRRGLSNHARSTVTRVVWHRSGSSSGRPAAGPYPIRSMVL